MKRVWLTYVAVWTIILLLSPTPPAVYASNPTVTVTKSSSSYRADIYTVTFSTNISLADTAFVFNENGNWFGIDGVGSHSSDSLITVECFTSETTADSVHYGVIYQVSSAATPTVTAGTFINSGWVTAYVDSVSFNNKATGSNPSISKFAKLRYAGQATKLRIVVAELQTGAYTAKDANQNVTLRIVIPRR
jgi:hypothetical protein